MSQLQELLDRIDALNAANIALEAENARLIRENALLRAGIDLRGAYVRGWRDCSDLNSTMPAPPRVPADLDLRIV